MGNWVEVDQGDRNYPFAVVYDAWMPLRTHEATNAWCAENIPKGRWTFGNTDADIPGQTDFVIRPCFWFASKADLVNFLLMFSDA